MTRWTMIAAAAATSLLASTPAWAGCVAKRCVQSSSETVSPILPPPDFNLQFSKVGERFAYNAATDLKDVGGNGVAVVSSPFALNVGSLSAPYSLNVGSSVGTTSTLYVSENGFVSFGQAIRSGSFTPVADLRSLGVPLIAPFYADLNQYSATARGAGYLGVILQQGVADPFADASGAYALADAKTALRVTWYGFDVTAGSPTFVQLLLIDEGGGDFDFKIRAGAPGSAGANSPAGGIGGFAFNDNYYQYDTPYDPSFAGAFSVRGGEIVAAAVPEPSGWALVIGGIGLAGATLRRRRPGRERRPRDAGPGRVPLPA